MVISRRLQTWSGPAIAAATVAVCAWFAGRLVSHVGEAEAFDDRRHAAVAVRAAAVSPTSVTSVTDAAVSETEHTQQGAALVTRNMFCSSCTPAISGGGPIIDGGGVHPVPRLIATSVGRDESWATIDDPVAGVSGLFARGARLPGGGVIEVIERGAIVVRFPDNTSQRVPLASGAAAVAAKDPVTAGAAGKIDDKLAGRIRKTGDNRWEVDRTLIRELVQAGTGQGAATRGVTLRPIGKDGQLAGIRVVTARKGSLGEMLGLQSGDTIETVDGKPIDSVERLMDLYGRLDDTRRVDLGIKRKSGNQTLVYDLP